MNVATRALQVGIVVMTVSIGVYAIKNPEGYGGFIAPMYEGVNLTLTPATIIALVSLEVVTSVLMLVALQAISAFFTSLGSERPFSVETGLLLRRSGLFALIGWAAEWVSNVLALTLVSASNPYGEVEFFIGFSEGDFWTLLAVGFLFTIGHAFVLASRMNEELEQVV